MLQIVCLPVHYNTDFSLMNHPQSRKRRKSQMNKANLSVKNTDLFLTLIYLANLEHEELLPV